MLMYSDEWNHLTSDSGSSTLGWQLEFHLRPHVSRLKTSSFFSPNFSVNITLFPGTLKASKIIASLIKLGFFLVSSFNQFS